MIQFAERLKEERKKIDVTQGAVAKYLGINEQSYQYYELGRRRPNFEMLVKLADYFDVTTDYLLGRSDNPDRR